MSILPSCIGVCIQSIEVVMNSGKIKNLMSSIKKLTYDYGVSGDSWKQLRKIDRIFKLMFMNVVVTFFAFLGTSIIAHEFVTKMWVPFDFGAGLNFWIVSIYQLCAVYYTGPLSMLFDILPVFFIIYASCMLTQLCEKLEELKASNSRKELVCCVKFHMRVLEVVKETQNIFKFTFITRGFLTIAILCTNVFSLVIISDSAVAGKLILYILIELVQIYLPCYYGSQINAISSKISQSIFHTEWIKEDMEYQQLVKIMMEASKRPIKISAFGIFDVNLETYKAICQSAYSMYCVLIKIVAK
jgi:hypothetical protein